jgi:uncharacterized protein (DUF58 family)
MIPLPKHIVEGEPLRLTDPETHNQYVLVRPAVYDQLQELLNEDTTLSRDEKRAMVLRAGFRAGWHHAEMDIYNNLDRLR